MNIRYSKYVLGILLASLLFSCASIPPEFLSAMEKERDGISLLKERHKQTVLELTDNWYNERLERLMFIKQLELDKITLEVTDSTGKKMKVIAKNQLLIKEKQFSEGVIMANKIRNTLMEGYADTDNWNKLVKLNAINLDMTRSLTELNQQQRKFYSELAGQNVPFPSDFINEKTQKMFK